MRRRKSKRKNLEKDFGGGASPLRGTGQRRRLGAGVVPGLPSKKDMEGEGGEKGESKEHGRAGRQGGESGLDYLADRARRISAAFDELRGLGLGDAVNTADTAPRDGGKVERGVNGKGGGAEQELSVVELAKPGPQQTQGDGRASPAGRGGGQRRGHG